MRWTVHLDGGPRRVNHAAVRVGDLIYSFGGYCTGDDYRFNESIDVHVLHIQTLRWYVVPQRRDEAGTVLKYPEVPFQRWEPVSLHSFYSPKFIHISLPSMVN